VTPIFEVANFKEEGLVLQGEKLFLKNCPCMELSPSHLSEMNEYFSLILGLF
jgi:hypothetical protein